MAKTPPADAAPVLHDAVEPAGDAAPRRRIGLPPAVTALLRRLPWRAVAAPKKMLLVAAAGVVAAGTAGAAAYAFWPADPPPRAAAQPQKPAARAKAAAASASAVADRSARAAAAAAARAAAEAAAASAATMSTAGSASAAASANNGSEAPFDRLQRRLAETLGPAGSLESGGGELKLTARRAEPAAASARRHPSRPHAESRAASHAALQARAERRTQAQAQARHAVPPWSYEGASGPHAWGALHPEFARCSSGTRQSPIDLRDSFRLDLDPIRFDYRPSRFAVIDNGHTVQVNVARGNAIEAMGRRFELQEFHFHRPSEERIAGRQSDMAAHLVHRDAEGRLAVVAVLLERGGAQPVVQAVWNNLPLEKGEEQAAASTIDLQQLLPVERGYFMYMGSLTTPPCSEGVLWLVMKQPVSLSAEQIALFARLYPMNARPVQSAAGRMLKESN